MKLIINQIVGTSKKLFAALIAGILINILAISISAQTVKTNGSKAPQKRALLIGISKYKSSGKPDGWPELNTELDVKLMKEVLIDKFKFTAKDIVVLQNEQATQENILSEMKKIASETSQGDIVFLYFAGHGDSIPDDGDDEIDGYDECLVPYDAVSTKDYSKHIRDDEIGKFLDKLKLKNPANVTVAFDSCFSGTATRGDFAGRGSSKEIDKPADESPSGLKDKNTSYPKEFIFLSAAAANPPQMAQETHSPQKAEETPNLEEKGKTENVMMGVFTLGLVTALKATDAKTTYRDLFERIQDVVTSKRPNGQTPQIEGIEGSLDETVLDGTAVRQERFFSAQPVNGSNNQVVLQTGYLLGATVKSQFALYNAGTKDPKDKDAVKITDGEIIQTTALTSILKLKTPVDPAGLKTARAFETQHYYNDSALKVILQNVSRVTDGDALLTEFVKKNPDNKLSPTKEKGFDLADFETAEAGESLVKRTYDIKIYPAGEKEIKDKIVPNDFRGLILERKDGSILEKIKENEDLKAEIKTALEREHRLRVIKGLKDNEDPRLKISLRIVQVEPTTDNDGKPACTDKLIGEIPRNTGGQPQLKVNDCVMMEIENQGESDAYVTILNLRADGKIGPGFPQRVEGTPDNFLPKGKKFLIPNPYSFRITEPLGDESFLAIATKKATDFTPLIDTDFSTRTISEKGMAAAGTPLGKLLLAAQKGTRSPIKDAPASWAISSFSYRIIGK